MNFCENPTCHLNAVPDTNQEYVVFAEQVQHRDTIDGDNFAIKRVGKNTVRISDNEFQLCAVCTQAVVLVTTPTTIH